MLVNLVGGPHCGANMEVDNNIVEGQVVNYNRALYVYYVPVGKIGRLVFYKGLIGY